MLKTLLVGTLCLLAACDLDFEGRPCDPGPWFEGDEVASPEVGGVGSQFLITWERFTEGGNGYRGVVHDGFDAVPGSQFDVAPGRRVYAVVSGPDRALVLGQGPFAEVRLASGTLVGTTLEFEGSVGGNRSGVFDGNAFVFVDSFGLFGVVTLDGALTIAPFQIPGGNHRLISNGVATWVLFSSDTDSYKRAARISRDSGLLDSPRWLFTDVDYQFAARPSETVVLSQSLAGVRTWTVLGNNGAVSQAPLALPFDAYMRPQALLPEADGYLLIIGRQGLRLAADGTPRGAPFDVFDDRAVTIPIKAAHTSGASILVFDRPAVKPGLPSISAIRIGDGELPSPEVDIEQMPGEYVSKPCGPFD